MAEVTVPLAVAQKGGLPGVCAMTGEPADGAIPLRVDRSWNRWRSPKVRIPLSTPAFKAWSRRQSVMLKTRMISIVFVVIALAFSARNAFAAITALAVAGVALAVSLKAERSLAGHEPEMSRSRGELHLRGVHPDFVRAVEAAPVGD